MEELLWDAFYAAAGANSEHDGQVERKAIARILAKRPEATSFFGEQQLQNFAMIGGTISWADLAASGLVSKQQMEQCDAMLEELELMTPRSPQASPESQHPTSDILDRIRSAKVLVRVPESSVEAAKSRCRDLLELGCSAAFLVQGGSYPGPLELVRTLRQALPSQCLVGLDHVMDASEVAAAAQAGAHFIVSPVHPPNFVSTCHAQNVLAIPSASTPNELWSCHIDGALLVRLDPVGVWSPKAVRQLAPRLRSIGKLASDPEGERAGQWLDGGAHAVELGPSFLGKDLVSRDSKDTLAWQQVGKARAGRVLAGLTRPEERGAQTERAAARGGLHSARGSQTARSFVPTAVAARRPLHEAEPNITVGGARKTAFRGLDPRQVFEAGLGNCTLSRLGAKHDAESTRKAIGSIRDRLKAM